MIPSSNGWHDPWCQIDVSETEKKTKVAILFRFCIKIMN